MHRTLKKHQGSLSERPYYEENNGLDVRQRERSPSQLAQHGSDLMKTWKSLTAAAAFSIAATAPLAARAAGVEVLNEGFGNVSGLPGWTQVNRSVPPGTGWFQGNQAVFPAHAGAVDSYVATSFLGAQNGFGSVDNWLITPVLNLTALTTLTFFTRAGSEPGFADKIEVRFSSGSGTDTGTFTTLLSTIGPSGFPQDWTEYSLNLMVNGTGRFAFRYLGDAETLNFIGIDSVRVVTAVPEPELYMMLAMGLGALGLMRRKLVK
jgi:hypothetical protein